MKKFLVLILFSLMLVMVGCNGENFIPVSEMKEGQSVDGTYKQFTNINLSSSYLGYGYDLINDEYIKKDNINLSAPIIDMEKIKDAKLRLIKENNAETYYVESSTMEDFQQQYATQLKVYGKAGKAFSGGLSVDYKGSEYEKTYWKFFKSIISLRTFNLYLTNSTSEIRELLSEEFKYDLLNMNVEALFDKYGTHMLKEVSMGGRIEISSQYNSSKSGETDEIKMAVNSHIKALKSASINIELMGEYESALEKEEVEYHTSVKQIGGKLTNINSIESLNEKYDAWMSSFDESMDYSALCGIVGENSLIALWDLLPEEYNDRREVIYQKFVELSGDSFEQLCEQFKINTERTLNVIVEGPGSINNDYSYKNKDGDEITLKATPNENAKFLGWYNNSKLMSTSLEYTFNIHVNTNLTAKFKSLNDSKCQVLVHIDGQGEVTGNEIDMYNVGDTVILTAKPNYNNSFIGWIVNNEIVSTNTSYIFIIEKDTSIIASFTNNEIEKVKLAVNKVGEGAVEGFENEYYVGSVATVKAKPSEGYVFEGWYKNGNKLSSSLEYSFFIEENTILEARFELKYEEEFIVSVTVFPNGCGEISGIETSYEINSIVSLNAKPLAGYVFDGWYANDGQTLLSKATNYSFPIENNTILIAKFVEKPNTVKKLDYNLNEEKYGIKCEISSPIKELTTNKSTFVSVPYSKYSTFNGWYAIDKNSGSSKEILLTNSEGFFLHNISGYTDSYGKWIYEDDVTLYADWTKEYEGYQYIYTKEQFLDIKKDLSGNYLICERIDLKKLVWESGLTFSGIIDGTKDCNIITGWSMIQNGTGNFGLFGVNTGTIKNLTVDDFAITSNDPDATGTLYAGLICAINNGIIDNVKIVNSKSIIDLGSMSHDSSSYVHCGLICGINTGSIKNSSIVSSTSSVYVGTKYQDAQGFVGLLVGKTTSGNISNIDIRDCNLDSIAKADIKTGAFGIETGHGRPRLYVGKVIGYALGTIIDVNSFVVNNVTLIASIERPCNHDTNCELAKGEKIGKSE